MEPELYEPSAIIHPISDMSTFSAHVFAEIPTGKRLATIGNPRLLLLKGYPIPGRTTQVRQIRSEHYDESAVLLHGDVLVKTLSLSIDPYMRNQMREADSSSSSIVRLLFSQYMGCCPPVIAVLETQYSRRCVHKKHISCQHCEYIYSSNPYAHIDGPQAAFLLNKP
jgi:hypothetical protein